MPIRTASRGIRGHTYGEKGLIYQSPLYKSAEVEGGKMRLRFDTGGAPLIVGKKTGLAPVVPTLEAKLDWFGVHQGTDT